MVITRLTVVLTVLAVAVILYGSVQAFDQPSQDSGQKRADIIKIDGMKSFGNLERSGVVFLHDLHTSALQKVDKDCTACHLSDNSKLSLKFKRLKDTSKNEVMNIYHDNCISCHVEVAGKGDKSGPTTCGECHVKTSAYVASGQPPTFDKSLHYRHSKSQENKCELCHHEYDNSTKKLIYKEGQEGSCRYCHKDVNEENRMSMKSASHIACIDCHQKTLKNKMEAGPVQCGGCHDPDSPNTINRTDIKNIVDVPRMERKQPDFTMVKTDVNDKEQKGVMDSVPFDHKAHEGYNDSCIVCHHKDLTSCSSCHSIEGKKEGGFISLEQVMHNPDAKESCVGCHESKKKDKDCAGCHELMGKHSNNSSNCGKCHMEQVGNMKEATTSHKSKTDKSARLAEMMLKSRTPITATYNDEDIPEKILIKDLSNKYEPVEFPHRKIVKALVNNINNNKLASYFHAEKGTICQGCHHNTPPGKQPPRCVSCHVKQAQDKGSFKIGLMGAYHLQCMGCHKEMGMEKPVSCTDCHKEKAHEPKK
ncbi:sulfate respiration complex hexadecaheme cytochrome HmcA [Desulforegula conservatrix]|uniref:sulfate respiration complex hexadecaheme cytochrome HmcA n=1 Tax=Desulforegula conservatrix TaxID=153026 RepID=UPI0004033A62|nr:cytochrome c3 family protein [Desulforegula conservatrix]